MTKLLCCLLLFILYLDEAYTVPMTCIPGSVKRANFGCGSTSTKRSLFDTLAYDLNCDDTSYTEEECWYAGLSCEYDYYENVCVDYAVVCDGYLDQDSCEDDLSCEWDDFGSFCGYSYFSNDKCEVHLDVLNCTASSNCTWDSDFEWCYTNVNDPCASFDGDMNGCIGFESIKCEYDNVFDLCFSFVSWGRTYSTSSDSWDVVVAMDSYFYDVYGLDADLVEAGKTILSENNCDGTDFWMDVVYMNSHLYLLFTPVDFGSICMPYAFDARPPSNDSSVVVGFFRKVQYTHLLYDSDYITIGIVTIDEVRAAINDTLGEDGMYHIVKNNCAKKVVRIINALGYSIDTDIAYFVESHIAESNAIKSIVLVPDNLKVLYPNLTLAEAKAIPFAQKAHDLTMFGVNLSTDPANPKQRSTVDRPTDIATMVSSGKSTSDSTNEAVSDSNQVLVLVCFLLFAILV